MALFAVHIFMCGLESATKMVFLTGWVETQSQINTNDYKSIMYFQQDLT